MSGATTIQRQTFRILLGIAILGAAAAVYLSSAAGSDAMIKGLELWRAIGARFALVNTATPLVKILFPTLIFGGLLYGMMLLYPTPGRPLRAAVILLLSALYTVYIVFRLFCTLNLESIADGIFSVLFFLAELLIYIKSLSANLQMFWPTNRSAQATQLAEFVTSGRFLPTVDIFLPTYSEPVEMLRRSVLGCQALSYPRKQIYLLDDQRRPEMRALALELGCNYRDRPDNRHAKAGNMNAALPTSSGDLIAVLDADFIPTEDFLTRTVGFFMDPQVGLVQTPQNFFSVDAVSRNLGLPGVITEEQQVFFRAAQPGRDTLGAIICHGTSFVIRRSALEEIGQFPGETLSEDWATSIKLQSAGYKTYYLNELVSAGAAAEFVSEFVTQRLRWARGTLQCFHASTNPLTVPNLTPLQRLVHLCGPIHYLPFACRFFCLLLPLLYFFFGIVPLRTSAELLLLFFLPYLVCQALSLSWLTGGHRSAFWSEVYETMLCYPMTITVISSLLRPFGKPFKVSKKGETRHGLTFNPVVGLPLAILLGLYLVAMGYAILHAAWFPSRGIFLLALGWSVYSSLLLWLSLQASFDVPLPSKTLRFRHRLAATLRQRGVAFAVTTEEISDDDLVFEVSEEVAATLDPEAPLSVSLPAGGLQDVPVRVLQNEGGGRWSFQFQRLSIDQHRALIALLYGRAGQWDDRGVSEHVTFWHFLEAPFRMYPLAETR